MKELIFLECATNVSLILEWKKYLNRLEVCDITNFSFLVTADFKLRKFDEKRWGNSPGIFLMDSTYLCCQ